MKLIFGRSGGLIALILALWLGMSGAVFAVDPPLERHPGSVERAKSGRAAELLDAAVAYLRHNGPKAAFAAFNDPNSTLHYGAYYVYVIDMKGYMHANGSGEFGVVATDVIDLRDAAGKPMVRDLIAAAQQAPSGSVNYRWRNPEDKQIELKVSLYERVDDYIVCVGYYTPRSTRVEAQALLDRAVGYVQSAGPDKAFAAFNDPQGGFMHDDQYVFVVGIDDGRYRASGVSPHLNGMDVRGIKDAAGYSLFEAMIDMARRDGSGTVDYVWRNPATNAVESKHTLIQRVGDVLLGVGYYTR